MMLQKYISNLTAKCDSTVLAKMSLIDTMQVVNFLTQSDRSIDLNKIRTETPLQTKLNVVLSMSELLKKLQSDKGGMAAFIKKSYTQNQIPEAIRQLDQLAEKMKPKSTPFLKQQTEQLVRRAFKPYLRVEESVDDKGESTLGKPSVKSSLFDMLTATNVFALTSLLMMVMLGNILAMQRQYPTRMQVILGSMLIGLFFISHLYQAFVPMQQYNQVHNELMQTYANVPQADLPPVTWYSMITDTTDTIPVKQGKVRVLGKRRV
ncbi:MAG: hypothetical protein EBX37_04770 [Alphaproteobacteria bacterium]|nr:hypothetical protein [Alphaproteobacteria bacterium]